MKQYLQELFTKAAEQLPYLSELEFQIEVPKIEAHGDLSVNAAMLLAKKLGKKPRDIASEIVASLSYNHESISKIEIAGPGFINFYFTPAFISTIIPQVITAGEGYGRSDKYANLKGIVEFVSANPTGPLTVGHGRNAVVGDTIANLLEHVGYTIDREYYFNNAGNQMRVLGDSVKHRYLALLGDSIVFPDDYYQGEYINDIAKELHAEYGDTLRDERPEGKFKERAEQVIFNDIKNTLDRVGIRHSVFYNENTLYSSGRINGVLESFKEKNLLEEREGAVWLKLSELGGEKDKVIVKSTGEPTYRLPDIAYHITKFERGYDIIVDLFGSDHIATYPDVLAGLQALGYDSEKVKVVIHQFVTVIKDNKPVKMSTRKANYITIDELLDEVHPDVFRYFFNMRSVGSHLNFDLDLAVKQSDENPVFYLQYAHARICSILRSVEESGLAPSEQNLGLLSTPEELRLIKKLYEYPEEVLSAAEQLEPNRITTFLEDLASAFHKFYAACRIIGQEKELAEARIALIIAVKTVIKNGLTLLGLTAPERM